MNKHLTRIGTSAFALFPVWLCNGLWHGAGWHYIFYGMYYFSIILGGIIIEPVKNRVLAFLHIPETSLWWKVFQIGKTWLIIFTGELFFRADSLRIGVSMFLSLFRNFNLAPLRDGTFLQLGLSRADFYAIAGGLCLTFLVSLLKEHGISIRQKINGFASPIRWGVYYALIMAVVIFGAYGAGYQPVDLIYAGF